MEKRRLNNGNIPTISITAQTIPEAWEKAVLAVYDFGIEIPTQYDKTSDKPSLDATVMITIENPLAEPRIHKNFPGGPEELEVYRQEVVEGIHDHWINPQEGKWTYTYHERLFKYCPTEDLRLLLEQQIKPFAPVNQIENMIEQLSKTFYTRRAQAITWMPTADPKTEDPPCLQRLWARIALDESNTPVLNVNTDWRSRDLYKAWLMNVFAITSLQRKMADKISKKIGKPVKVGRYCDKADSLHIYGSYRDEKFEKEVEKMRDGNWNSRAYHTSDLQEMFDEAAKKLKKDPDYYAKGKS